MQPIGPPNILANKNMRTCGILCHQGPSVHPKRENKFHIKSRKQRCDDVSLVNLLRLWFFLQLISSGKCAVFTSFQPTTSAVHSTFSGDGESFGTALCSTSSYSCTHGNSAGFFPFNALHPTHNKVISSFQGSLTSKVLLFNISTSLGKPEASSFLSVNFFWEPSC